MQRDVCTPRAVNELQAPPSCRAVQPNVAVTPSRRPPQSLDPDARRARCVHRSGKELADVEPDDQARRDAGRHTAHVDEDVPSFPPRATERYDEVVPHHAHCADVSVWRSEGSVEANRHGRRSYEQYEFPLACTNMAESAFDTPELKRLLKEALAEALVEQRELLHEVFAEVLEDLGLAEAIREGRESAKVERRDVFDILEERS
jgi:hypothetical protein